MPQIDGRLKAKVIQFAIHLLIQNRYNLFKNSMGRSHALGKESEHEDDR
jgi:hypothetical protein